MMSWHLTHPQLSCPYFTPASLHEEYIKHYVFGVFPVVETS